MKEHPVSLSNVIRLKLLSLMKVSSEHNLGLKNKTNFFSYKKIPPCFLLVLRGKLKEKRFVCNKCEIIFIRKICNFTDKFDSITTIYIYNSLILIFSNSIFEIIGIGVYGTFSFLREQCSSPL